jgi:hypothetical protein
MSEKEEKETVELLWGITDKLDGILAAIVEVGKLVAGSGAEAGDSASQMTIDTGEPK